MCFMQFYVQCTVWIQLQDWCLLLNSSPSTVISFVSLRLCARRSAPRIVRLGLAPSALCRLLHGERLPSRVEDRLKSGLLASRSPGYLSNGASLGNVLECTARCLRRRDRTRWVAVCMLAILGMKCRYTMCRGRSVIVRCQCPVRGNGQRHQPCRCRFAWRSQFRRLSLRPRRRIRRCLLGRRRTEGLELCSSGW